MTKVENENNELKLDYDLEMHFKKSRRVWLTVPRTDKCTALNIKQWKVNIVPPHSR